MSEHFTRNTLNMWVWCSHCAKLTEHAVSNGHLGRCVNDHHKPTSPRTAQTPRLEYETGAVSSPASKKILETHLFLQALDGPDSPHDGKGNLPAKREENRRTWTRNKSKTQQQSSRSRSCSS